MSTAVNDVKPYTSQLDNIAIHSYFDNSQKFLEINDDSTYCRNYLDLTGGIAVIPGIEEASLEINILTSKIPPTFIKNQERLRANFQKAIESNPEWYQENSHFIKYKFEELSSLLSELPFTKTAIELAQSETLKYTLLFPNNRMLLISQSFGSIQDLDVNQVLFSFFINRELVMSNVVEPSVLVKSFKGLL